MSLRLKILLVLIVLLPISKSPLADNQLIARPSDILALLLFPIIAIYLARTKGSKSGVIIYATLAFLVYSIASIFYGIHNLEALGLSSYVSSTENLSYSLVALKRILLLVVCFGLFHFVSSSASRSLWYSVSLIRYWFYGLCVAVFFHLLSYVFGETSMVYRGGLFLEGNHAGGYYLLTFFLMLCAKELKLWFANYGIAISIIGIGLSQSTTTIVLLLAIGLFKIFSSFELKKLFAFRFFLGLAALLTASAVLFIIFGDVLFEKLFGQDVNAATFSRLDRLATIVAGYNIFLDYPLFGIGIQGFGFVLSNYAEEFLGAVLQISDARRIPNNIYVEIISELGIIGFILFSFLIFSISRYAFFSRCNIKNVKYAFVSVFLTWLAFPTYAVSFHWIAFGLLYALSINKYSFAKS